MLQELNVYDSIMLLWEVMTEWTSAFFQKCAPQSFIYNELNVYDSYE